MSADPASESPLLGLTLGHYRITEKIGAGGMGEVYQAYDEHLGRIVAIKVLRKGTLADEHSSKQFRKEATALSRLNHPNIATVHDFDTQQGTDFLVMEHIPGVSLSEKLAAEPLLEKEVLRLGLQLAEGLSAAHEQGVVHRDLKPGNLRITRDGWLKILDFGLAKLRQPVPEGNLAESVTETHVTVGTVPYMAPEQLLGGEIDARTDLHAAGAVLYEMATGRRPFAEEERPQLIGAILHKSPPPPSTLNSRVSPELDRIIGKCLEKDPANRYQSAKELAIDLGRLAVPGTSAVPARNEKQRTGTLILGAGALLVVAAAVLFSLNVGGLRSRWLGRAAGPGIRSLAVLPLENISADPGQDYFTEGMTEELITNLGKISGLRVISRTSVMQYKGTKKTATAIAGELNVDALVEGSVLRSGDRARISALLIQANPERQLWGESYEGSLQDILKLQAEVARAVAREIAVKLTPRQQEQLAQTRPLNPQAHDAYLRGRYYWNQRTENSLKKSLEYFQQAVAYDPQYALAYSGLADVYDVLPGYANISPKETLQLARAAARKAIQLDDSLAEAHTSLAAILADDDWDFPAAEREFQRAIELNPNYATAHQWYAESLSYEGRFDEAAKEIREAQELDPLSLVMNVAAGVILIRAQKYDQAIVELRKAIDLDEDFLIAYYELRHAYEYKSMFPEAITESEAAAVAQGVPTERAARDAAVLRQAYADRGERGYWNACVRQAQENISSGKAANLAESSVRMASLYARLGDADSSVQWLEKALEQRNIELAYVRTAPEFQALLSDPRVLKILRQAGLSP